MYVLTVLLNGPLKRNMNLKCLKTVGAPGWLLLIFGLQVPAPQREGHVRQRETEMPRHLERVGGM